MRKAVKAGIKLEASLSSIVLLLCTFRQKTGVAELFVGKSFRMQELKVYQPQNLTSSGEKVALTQVVEHHLPTYASLALVKQK